MPELPQVQTVRKFLFLCLLAPSKRKIKNFKLYYPGIVKQIEAKIFINTLIGQTFQEIDRYGKYLILKLNKYSIISHLRMQGKYSYHKKKLFLSKTNLHYFCIDCQQTICSQCLLQGSHRQHSNQSISQILQNQLPIFINQASEILLKQINQIECSKQQQSIDIHQGIKEIQKIKFDALSYFQEVQKNIEKQKKQVIGRCDLILEDFGREQKEIRQAQNFIQTQISNYIKQIKSLKINYQSFLHDSDRLSLKRDIQNEIIQSYISCSKQIKHLCKKNIIQVMGPCSKIISAEKTLKSMRLKKSLQTLRDSMIFQKFDKQISKIKQNSLQPKKTSVLTLLNYNQAFTQDLDKSKYISNLSKQNSLMKNKPYNDKQVDRSPSISPYKPELLKSKNCYKQNLSPFVKSYNTKASYSSRKRKLTDLSQNYPKNNLRDQIAVQNDMNGKNLKYEQKMSLKSTKKSQNLTKTSQKQQKKSITKKNHPPNSNNRAINRFRI